MAKRSPNTKLLSKAEKENIIKDRVNGFSINGLVKKYRRAESTIKLVLENATITQLKAVEGSGPSRTAQLTENNYILLAAIANTKKRSLDEVVNEYLEKFLVEKLG